MSPSTGEASKVQETRIQNAAPLSCSSLFGIRCIFRLQQQYGTKTTSAWHQPPSLGSMQHALVQQVCKQRPQRQPQAFKLDEPHNNARQPIQSITPSTGGASRVQERHTFGLQPHSLVHFVFGSSAFGDCRPKEQLPSFGYQAQGWCNMRL